MKKKIFIIDDDEGIAQIIGIFLKEEGYTARLFRQGYNIRPIIHKENPSLIILDYLLPVKNGAEIARIIRKDRNLADLPIIMIAANHIYKQTALSSGANEFLDKPFDMYELLNLVKRYTGKRQS